MTWTVSFTRKASKQVDNIPKQVRSILTALVHEIGKKGPVRGDWPNYGKLAHEKHHCHLKKGRPTYVAVWEESDRGIRLVEITYVGTHEKAPY
jgi:mRNA-degrading endonuclease RelE of RelBE toxin-antitoxin system